MMFALVLAELTCSLESGMLYVALSDLYRDYGDPISVGWLLTAFTLTSAASAAVAGRLGDLFGRRRVLLFMLALAFAGSALSAMTSNLTIIIVGRAIQGISMAVLPLSFGVLREIIAKRDMGLAISTIGATYAVGGGLGVILGGAIVDNFDWHGIFIVSSAMALVAIIMVLIFVPGVARKPVTGPIDLVGGVLFAPAVAMVLYGVSEGSGRGWSVSLVAIMLAGLALLAFWFRHEWRLAIPLIDVRQLAKREVGFANLALGAIALGPLLGPAMIMPMLQQPVWTGIGFGIAATTAGLAKLPGNVTAAIGTLFSGALSRRINVRTIMLVAAIGSALGWFGLAFMHDDFWLVFILMTLLIVPTGTIILSMIPQIVIQAVPEDRTSEATGLSQVVRAFSKAIGTQLIALCFASEMIATPEGGSYPAESAFVTAFVVTGCLSLVSAMFLFALPRNTRSIGGEHYAKVPTAA